MADTFTYYQEVAKAIPVVVGGILAIGGGIVGHLVTHHLTGKREWDKFRRERLESLVKSLYAHEQWLLTKHNTLIFRNEDHDTPSPLDEARMLQALHFPELLEELSALQQAQIPILQFINDQRIARMANQETWMKAWNAEPFNEAYRNYLLTVGVVTTKCRNMLNGSTRKMGL